MRSFVLELIGPLNTNLRDIREVQKKIDGKYETTLAMMTSVNSKLERE